MTLSTINKFAVYFIVFLFLSQVEAVAQCGFTANQRNGCQPLQLSLQDTTAGSVNTSWTVVLADGTVIHTSSNSQFAQLINVCGPIKVTMTTTVGGVPCTVVDSNFMVYCKPKFKGRFTPLVACENQNVCFLDSSTTSANCYPLKYIINWGQSPLDTVPGCRRYTLSGTFCPSVIVTNSCGCTSDTLFAAPNCIQINPIPIASFTGTPLSSCATPLTSTMTAQPAGAGTIYNWYINGSSVPAQSNASNVFTHSYNAGIYSIKLITVNPLTGCSDTMNRNAYINVGNIPAACYSAAVTVGCAPRQIRYCPCNNGALSYVWSFPGSTTPNITSATNACQNVNYTNPGAYSSQLIVYYNGGCVDTLTRVNYISLGQPYTLGMTSPDSFSCRLPDTVQLNYTGPPCATCQFSWNPPGNSTPSSHTGTQIILNSYQFYTPVLTVVDTFGCVSTLIRNNYIAAQKIKASDIKLLVQHTSCINDTFLIINTTLGKPFASVVWNFPGAVTRNVGQDSVYLTYAASGCHKYTLIVTTISGCVDTLRDSICVGTKPIVTMTVNPHDICFEQACNDFEITVSAGSGTPDTVLVWPEGLLGASSSITDIIVDSVGHPFHNCYFYQDFGTFTPCFVAKLQGCIGDTICLIGPLDSVHIKAPAAKFQTLLDCSNPNRVTYINQSKQADSIWWNINGVVYTNVDTVTVVYPGPCGTTHSLSLSAYNYSTQCLHVKQDTTYLQCLGVDFIGGGSRSGCFGVGYVDSVGIVYVDTNATHPTNVIWDVNVVGTPHFASPPDLSGNKIPVALFSPGVYKICVQLTFGGGCVDTLCKSNYIVVSKPTASFTVSDTAGCLPFTVHFSNTSIFQFATEKKFYWSFGDNSLVDSTTINPNHTYDSVNAYIATLTVIDSNGCSSIATRQIIANLVVADFMTSDTVTCTANADTLNPITFTNTSTGFVAHLQWLLPASLGPTNPNPGDVPSFSTRFTQQGYDSVCMIAIDQANICRDTVCKPIHVINPIADYTLTNLADTFHLCPPVVINPFIDLSQNDICKCYWDFGDGSHYDTACNASHIYTVPGNYPVTHIVTSCHGCSDTTVKYNIHIKGPSVSMSASAPGGCPCVPITYYISSYNADSLYVLSGGGSPLFVNLGVPRGTAANPTLDTLTFTYCSVGNAIASVTALDLVDNSCRVFFPSPDTLIIDTPTVDFTHRWLGCGNDTFCFVDITQYTTNRALTVHRSWDFGDGSVADTTPAPCHAYPGPGDYSVILSVTDNVGCVNTMTHSAHVASLPIATMGVDDTIGCVPLTLHFTESSTVDDSTTIASGFWSFGDGGGYPTFTDTSHTYTTPNIPPATYTVILVIQDGYGCQDTATKQITVLPQTVIGIGPAQTVCIGDTVTLSGSGSPTLHWSPSYNIDTTNLAAPRVWPQVDTTYYLRAGGILRCYVYDSVRVSVSVITAADTAWPLCVGQITTLSAAAQTTHASISSYIWNFGDGTTGTGPSIGHIYPVYGTYTDSLIVINSLGCRDTLYRQVLIHDNPHAMISVSDSAICLGNPITVTNASTAGASIGLGAFSIDMQPDGVIDYTTSPATYTYPKIGVYTIVLVQTDSNTCTDTAKQRIVIHSVPKAFFAGDSNCILLSNVYDGSAIIGDGDITQYHWTIDGAAQGSDSSLMMHTFATPGSYNVCLAVSDIYGCTSPDTCNTVTIISQPTDTISPLDTTICPGYSAAFHIKGNFSNIQWVPSTWVDNPTGTDVVITPRQPMQYLVYATYGHCYPTIDTVSIWVIDSLPIEATADPENIVLGLSSNVTSTVKGTIDSIVWDPDTTLSCRTCRNPIATPKRTTTYTATIYYSKNGITCSNRASVTITVITSCDNSLIYVPNTFTPNNDNTNDVFRIRGQGISNVNYFRVFDRWGKMVYEAKNVENPDDAAWNGGLNNDKTRPENSGVFVYLFEIKCITGQTVTGKGNVTLIR